MNDLLTYLDLNGIQEADGMARKAHPTLFKLAELTGLTQNSFLANSKRRTEPSPTETQRKQPAR